jgi:hypothetical protein
LQHAEIDFAADRDIFAVRRERDCSEVRVCCSLYKMCS